MVVQLIVPLIQITLFCTCIGRPPLDIPVGFVDNEPSGQFVRLGRQFIDEIDNTTITKVCRFFTCLNRKYTANFPYFIRNSLPNSMME